jgi:Xaa-Pro aminopeptidase
MDFVSRLFRVRQSMAARKLDAVLISQPENRRYLSGYTVPDHGIGESSGLLFIRRQGTPYLITDSRFVQQAEKETSGYKVVLHSKGVLPLLKELLTGLGVRKLGFESNYTLHSIAEKYFDLGRSQGIEIIPVSGLIERMRVIKTEDEIERIRKSVQLNEEIFREVYHSLDGADTEIDVALRVNALMKNRGAEGESFDTIVAAGPESSLPHAIPGNTRRLKDNPVVIDMGLILNGYCSDMTRSFYFGKANQKYLKIHRIVRLAQQKGIAAVRAGVSGRQIDKAARDVIVEAGYGKYFGHSLGHGVGMAVHENPRVSPKSRKRLQAGMVITIEPGIYIPGWGGIRLENMVVVREDGCENLNTDTTCLDI